MQIIHSTSNSPTFNLAAEEFLFSERQDDLLFLYVNDPSVIIGCNQAIRNEVNLEFCAENNIQVVRRISGGGAVYHDLGNLNFCFISNRIEGNLSLNDDFLTPIVKILTDLKVPVEIGKRNDLWLQSDYKITGTASHISKNRELHHGTLLYDTNLDMLRKTLTPTTKDENLKSISSVKSTVKNLRTWYEEQNLLTLTATDFFILIRQRLADFFQEKKILTLLEEEAELIRILEGKKYLSWEWTYKK
jgi:lipoate-protein ligase A